MITARPKSLGAPRLHAPASRQASMDPTLTNYAFAVLPDLTGQNRTAGFVGDWLFPETQVPAASGKYKAFDSREAFVVEDTHRPIGGRARQVQFDVSDPTYDCSPHALDAPVDDHERDSAGDLPGAQEMLEQSKIKITLSRALVSREVRAIAKAKTVAAATGGVWSDPDVDPIKELDEQIAAIGNETGQMANKIVLGLGAWRILRGHPAVVKRAGGVTLSVGLEQVASMLLNPQIQIRVGTVPKDTAKKGNAKANANIVGEEVFVFMSLDAPTLYDPSFGKTFTTRAGSLTQVRRYRDDGARSDVLAVDWSEDIRVVGSSLLRRLTLS